MCAWFVYFWFFPSKNVVLQANGYKLNFVSLWSKKAISLQLCLVQSGWL